MADEAHAVDAALKEMADGVHALICKIDQQTHEEWRRHDYDAPDDCEFLLTLTAKDLLLLDKVLDAYANGAGKARAAVRAAQADSPNQATRPEGK